MTKPDIRNYPDVMLACQSIADLVGTVCQVPATLIMRKNTENMEVITSSNTESTPYHSADSESLGSGLYCETVIKNQQPLHVPDALSDPEWNQNPDIKLDMISYYGVPINWPDGSTFGTFCALKSQPASFQESHITIIKEFAHVVETLLLQVINQNDLKILADHDPLTNTLSRRALLSKLQHEFERYLRYQTPLTIIYLDLDHFKLINDNFGHNTGDKVLQSSSEIIVNSQRQTDFVGRLGGEEFLICLTDTEIANGAQQARRILDLLLGQEIVASNKALRITASCGVAQACKSDNDIDKLISRADSALYTAKKNGRNKVECANAN